MSTDRQDGTCDVCGRRDSWGCGHTGSQRWAARRHNATALHRDERCHHYTDPPRPGWYPAQHSPEYLARHTIDPHQTGQEDQT